MRDEYPIAKFEHVRVNQKFKIREKAGQYGEDQFVKLCSECSPKCATQEREHSGVLKTSEDREVEIIVFSGADYPSTNRGFFAFNAVNMTKGTLVTISDHIQVILSN
jgi:hypothetical protein